MGNLDEKQFDAAIAGCSKCDYKAFEVSSYLDREVSVMLGASNHDGRWTHGDKFIDGVFRIKCLGCKTLAYESTDCPRCHRANGLAAAIGEASRLKAPQRCPSCTGTELTLTCFAPATVKAGDGRPAAPAAIALLGDPGYHVAIVMCDSCNWVLTTEDCPLCGGPGPLRARPG